MELRTWNTRDTFFWGMTTVVYLGLVLYRLYPLVTIPESVTLADTYMARAIKYKALGFILGLSGIYFGYLISMWKDEKNRRQLAGAALIFLISVSLIMSMV